MCALGRWMGKEMTPLASLRWIVRGLCKWVGEIYKAIHTATFLDSLIPNLKNHAGPFLKRHLGFFFACKRFYGFHSKKQFYNAFACLSFPMGDFHYPKRNFKNSETGTPSLLNIEK